jgi:NADPH:quinone reductase-like Zn-dependent oxidoreductase
VTAVCSGSKLAAMRALGADHAIDYGVGDFADGKKQYDLLLDIGGNTKVARLRRALTATGRLVFVGNEYGGDWTAGFERPLGALMRAPFVRQRFAMLAVREHYADLERLAALAEQGQIAPRIDRAYALAAVPEAMRALEAGEICGKAVITLV